MSRLAARIEPILLPRMAIWAVAFWVLSITTADPDLWGHVRFGQDMLASGQLATADPYSFTSDIPWVNHEWLAELLMGAVYNSAGPAGLVGLKLVLLLTAFGIVTGELRSRGVPSLPRDVLLICAIVGCLTLTKTMRPQTFSLVLFAYLIWALRAAEDGRAGVLIGVPPAMALWANLHGGWLVGGGILFGWGALRLVWPGKLSRTTWSLLVVAGWAATLMTPEGFGLWRFLWDTVGIGRADITEWQALTSLPGGAAVSWLFVTPIALWSLRSMRFTYVTHAAVVVLLMLLSFKVMRLVSFYAVATVMLGGPHLVRPAPLKSQVRPPTLGAVLVVALMACIWLGSSAYMAARNAACVPVTGDWMVDLGAARAIETAHLRGRMLTWFDWGEYIIWHYSPGLRVSLDGRRETVYSDDVLARHKTIYEAAAGWEDHLSQLDPDHIWLPKSLPVTSRLEAAGWPVIFDSPRSVVFSRERARAVAPSNATVPQCFPG